jgi:D-glycero-alpha-D-manno-heptose-7-phosphate kinase
VDFGIDDPMPYDGRLDLVKAAVRRSIGDRATGFDLFLHSNAPVGSGLGASSAMAVCLIGLLQAHQGVVMEDYEVAHAAYVLEREDMGILGGLQDHYAATFGGFNFIEFGAEHVLVNPLRVPPDVVHELEHNLLLCYTGRTRMSDHIIDDQTARFVSGDAKALAGLEAQRNLAHDMKSLLLRGKLADFGALLDEAWMSKQALSDRISTPYIDEAYAAAREAGALGGKVTGAGGGGYMLFYCEFDKRHLVAEALIKLGMVVTEVGFDSGGLTTWRTR